MPDDKDLSRLDETPPAIPDVRGLPMAQILDDDDSAFSNAVRRVVRDASRPGHPWSAHGSTTSLP
jgi:FXSXX-COOH protein